MGLFRKKAVTIEAVPWVPDAKPECYPEWFWMEFGLHPQLLNATTGELSIKTLEGVMVAKPGDWIIRGVKGELYPCKPDIFAATYEKEGDESNACDTCGIGSHLPSGKCDHCDSLRVQLNGHCNEREEERAAMRRRGARFVRMNGTLELLVPDDYADLFSAAMPDDEIKRIDGLIQLAVADSESHDNIGSSDLYDICIRAMDLRDQVRFAAKEIRQKNRVIDELTRHCNGDK